MCNGTWTESNNPILVVENWRAFENEIKPTNCNEQFEIEMMIRSMFIRKYATPV